MAETIDQTKVTTTLEKLVDVLRDSHKGFLELEKHLQDESARTYFLKESQHRASFAAELENVLHHHGVADVEQHGSVAGTVHRAWGELKAKLGGGDHALLAVAESGEDAIKKAYKEALEETLPSDVRDVLTTQAAHIQTGHDTVKALRDSKA